MGTASARQCFTWMKKLLEICHLIILTLLYLIFTSAVHQWNRSTHNIITDPWWKRMTSSYRISSWPCYIIHIKLCEDWMIYDQVITLTSQEWALFAWNQWAVTLVMTSLKRAFHWPHCIIHIKFGEDRMRNGQDITLTCYEWAIFTINQWTVAPAMTSFKKVCP